MTGVEATRRYEDHELVSAADQRAEAVLREPILRYDLDASLGRDPVGVYWVGVEIKLGQNLTSAFARRHRVRLTRHFACSRFFRSSSARLSATARTALMVVSEAVSSFRSTASTFGL